ncbi:MAG: hypothetical protein ABH986_02640 [archaeon]
MKTITGKGIIEADFIAATAIILLMALLMMQSLNQAVKDESETKNLFYLKSKALFFADSLVKNSNTEEPEKGIAFYSSEKKRVEENVIDFDLAEKIKEESFPELLKEIRIESSGQKIVFGKKTGNCFEARRFVLIMQTGKKGVVFVSACS